MGGEGRICEKKAWVAASPVQGCFLEAKAQCLCFFLDCNNCIYCYCICDDGSNSLLAESPQTAEVQLNLGRLAAVALAMPVLGDNLELQCKQLEVWIRTQSA